MTITFNFDYIEDAEIVIEDHGKEAEELLLNKILSFCDSMFDRVESEVEE